MSLCRNRIAGRSEHPEQQSHAEESGVGANHGAPVEKRVAAQRPVDASGAGVGASAQQPTKAAEQKGWPSKRLSQNTRFFIMKSFCARDLKISMQQGIWATQQRNESKLNEAFDVQLRPLN